MSIPPLQLPDEIGVKAFGVRTERVLNKNEYTKLFKGIDDPEIDMREAKLEGKKIVADYRRGGNKFKIETFHTGRIFFYPVERTLYIVAIRANHYETHKR